MKVSKSEKGKEYKGVQIVMMGCIKKQEAGNFLIHSQSNPETWYTVKWEKDRWVCNCPDYQKHNDKCKHIHAVHYYITIERIKLGAENLDVEDDCPICGLKDNVIKRGIRHNQSGSIQRLYCKQCNKRFTGRAAAFKGMKNKTNIITTALDLYYRGLSLRQIVQHLEASHKLKISHGTIYYWIKKYVELITNNMGELNARFSDRWHADETILKVNGRHLLLWSLLDSETRFLIATHISSKRGEEDASVLMKKGAKTSREKPLEIVTDGLSSYDNAILKEFGSNPGEPLIHLQGSLTKALNNKMERMNGTIKSRTKNMAGLYNTESAIRFANGFSIYYNFIKPHTSLNQKTPAEAAGIANERYTWLDMIIKSKKNH